MIKVQPLNSFVCSRRVGPTARFLAGARAFALMAFFLQLASAAAVAQTPDYDAKWNDEVADVAADMGIPLSNVKIVHLDKAGGPPASAFYNHFGGQKWQVNFNSGTAKAHNKKFGTQGESYDCGVMQSLAIHEMIHACCGHEGGKGMFVLQHAYVDMEVALKLCEEIEELSPDPPEAWDPEDKKKAMALCDELEDIRDRWNEGEDKDDKPYDSRRKAHQKQGKKDLCAALKDPEGGPPCSPTGGRVVTAQLLRGPRPLLVQICHRTVRMTRKSRIGSQSRLARLARNWRTARKPRSGTLGEST